MSKRKGNLIDEPKTNGTSKSISETSVNSESRLMYVSGGAGTFEVSQGGHMDSESVSDATEEAGVV